MHFTASQWERDISILGSSNHNVSFNLHSVDFTSLELRLMGFQQDNLTFKKSKTYYVTKELRDKIHTK